MAACGGSQPSPAGVSSNELAVDAGQGSLFIVGEHVETEWAGRTWSGAPTRLGTVGAEPDGPTCGSSFLEAHETLSDPENLVAPDLPEADHMVLTFRGWTSSDACASEGEWTVARVGHGALLLYNGAEAGAVDPAEVMEAGGAIVTMRGWYIESGEWRAGLDVLGAFLEPASATGLVACVQHDGPGAADRLSSELLYVALGSPGIAEQARSEVAELALYHGGPLPSLLDGSLEEVPGTCLNSDVFRAATLASDNPMAAAMSPTSPSEATLQALAAFGAMEFDVAASSLDSALALQPGYAPALFLRGRLEEEVNVNPVAAGDAFSAAAADERLNAAASHRVALISEDLGEEELARDWYLRAADADPAYAAPVNALGFLTFEAGEFAEARTHFEEALRRDSSFAQAANNLGYIAENVDGDPVAASLWYERSIDADPNSVSAHVNLASVAVRHLGRVDEGETLLRAAIALDPRSREALDSLEALLARPSALAETMVGTWSGVDASSGASITATFGLDGSAALVTRVPGEEANAERYPLGEPANHRTQRVFRDADSAWMVEMISETVAHLYRPGNPLIRTVLTRRDGGMAMAL